MSRAILKSALIILCIGLFLFFFYQIRKKVADKKQAASKIQHLPTQKFFNLDSTDYYLPKQKVVLIFFNSGCEHCQNEMNEIKEKINLFKGHSIIFLSSENLQAISLAVRTFKLDSLPNVTFAKILPGDVFDTFGSVSIPHIFVYDDSGNLTQEFKGETKVEAIANSLQ